MPEVFIAYKKVIDSDKASFIRGQLEALGVTVFHDVDIGRLGGNGRDYFEIIEHQLKSASAVVVIWTNDSAESMFVRAEAEKGFNRRILVPVYFGGLSPQNLPVPFSTLQTHSLSGWRSEEHTSELQSR